MALADLEFVPLQAPPEINLVDVRELASSLRVRKVETEEPQEFFELLQYDESNMCESIIEINEALHGHSQLRDRITCSAEFPNSLFICGTKKILEYNRENKKHRVLYEAPNSGGYYILTAIKAYKNYLFFGDMNGAMGRLTLGSLTVVNIPPTNQYEMVNGFTFYEFEGKPYAVVALNSWENAIKTLDVEALQVVGELAVPHPEYKTCAGGASVSPSRRFMIVIGDKAQIYLYELVPDGNQCNYKIRKTFAVLGNCHTADWAPDESCFAVSCEHGEVYLFAVKQLSNNDLDIQLSATYKIEHASETNGDDYGGSNAIENVKFHPDPALKLMAFAGAYAGQIVIVDYATLQIVQKFTVKGAERPWNLGIDFAPDGKTLFVLFAQTAQWFQGDSGHLNQLFALKLKGVSTLTDLCLAHIRKNKFYWGEFDLQTLPETLYEKLALKDY